MGMASIKICHRRTTVFDIIVIVRKCCERNEDDNMKHIKKLPKLKQRLGFFEKKN